jgi:uncharacterized membrane protein YphA (DoxX/SURF4 family)
VTVPTQPAIAAPTPWSFPLRTAFRFTFLYFLIYNFPQPVSVIPGLSVVGEWYDRVWRTIVPWVGEHALHLPQRITIFPNGSGDTTFNYVQLLFFLALAVVGTILWTIAAAPFKVRHHDTLHRWFSFYLRVVLGMTLLSYGFVKVIKLQFPDLEVGRLVQTYGDSSPMGLLWTFMGASTPYTFFAGLSEVVGGTLLMFRRTALLGAIVSAGVMLHVALLNFCYDVPVKLYSSHLFLMACVIALPDAKRLIRAVVLNKPTPPAPERRLFERRWMDLTGAAVKAVLVLALIGLQGYSSIEQRRQMLDTSSQPKVIGSYDVTKFAEGGVDKPMLLSDATLWKRIGVRAMGTEPPSFLLSVRKMNNDSIRYNLALDEKTSEMKLTPWRGGSPLPEGETEPAPETLRYTLDGKQLTLEGTISGTPLKVELKRLEATDFLLVNRGFHWINETPFNR